MIPTICGYCGSPLYEGEDGLLHCSLKCPNWMNTVEAGLEPPEAFAGYMMTDRIVGDMKLHNVCPMCGRGEASEYDRDEFVKQVLIRFRDVANGLECACDPAYGVECSVHSDRRLAHRALEIYYGGAEGDRLAGLELIKQALIRFQQVIISLEGVCDPVYKNECPIQRDQQRASRALAILNGGV